MDYSNWAPQPITSAGYLGDAFIDFEYSVNGFSFDPSMQCPEPSNPILSISIIPYYTKHGLASVRVAQSQAELESAPWQGATASVNYTIDPAKTITGMATIYVQAKDTFDNLSSPVAHDVPYGSPVISGINLVEARAFTASDTSYVLSWTQFDAGSIQQEELLLNGFRVWGNASTYDLGDGQRDYRLGLQYMATGSYSLTIRVTDSQGNVTEQNRYFTINRSASDTWTGSAWNSSTGELNKDVGTIYLWNLASDGTEAGGNPSHTLSGYYNSTKGLNGGATHSYTAEQIPLTLPGEAFTIELWKKGQNDGYINKQGVFHTGFGTGTGLTWYTVVGTQTTSSYISPWFPSDQSTWHHYAYVYNGTSMRCYVDGILISFTDGFVNTLPHNASQLYMWFSDSNSWVDEIRISSVPRSADELRAYWLAAKDKIVE